LNGPAIVEACKILSERLQPFKDANPNGTWEQWVKAAYFARVNLSTTGFTKLEFPGPFNYQVFGTGCTEVEIDCLTGEVSIIRTDIVMDVGESLNPAIDIGQIEGAFVQAMGWVTMEEVGVTPDGHLTATGPFTYKIPGVADIPQEFNVSLLRGSSNPRAVYSSKAIGEPPFLLVSSVFFAIKNAVKEARKDANLDSQFAFCPPATAEKIRIACAAFGGTN
jgi:xanthine dehydrogenase/oxidase